MIDAWNVKIRHDTNSQQGIIYLLGISQITSRIKLGRCSTTKCFCAIYVPYITRNLMGVALREVPGRSPLFKAKRM